MRFFNFLKEIDNAEEKCLLHKTSCL